MERYKKECQKINEQINPSDEFIQNLKTNLNQKVAEKEKRRYNLSKVAAIFITLTLVSTGVFAKDIGNWFAKIFSNVDESVQVAVEHGFVQNVDMDYIEHDGIAIKVNSLIIDDNKINIVFDVKGEKEAISAEIDGDIAFKDFKLTGDSEEYSAYDYGLVSTCFERKIKKINSQNCLIIAKLSNIEQPLSFLNNITVVIDGIYLKNKNDITEINNNIWEFDVDITNENYKNLKFCKYEIEENEFVNLSEIKISNTSAALKLNFKANFEDFKLITKESIFVEKDNGEVFVCRDVCRIENNTIKMNIPLTVYDETENLKIKIKLPDEEIVLNAYKIDNSQDV